MWRALSRFSSSQSRHFCRSVASSPVTFSGECLRSGRLGLYPAVAPRLISNGESSRFFSDHSAVRSGEEGPAGAVITSSSESDDDRVQGFAGGNGLDGAVEMSSVESDAGTIGDAFAYEADSMAAPIEDGDGASEAFEIDPEELESVVSLLQGTSDGSVELKLDAMHLLVHEQFVLKVLKTPAIPGEGLIVFFRWASSKPEKFQVTRIVIEALVHAVCNGNPPKKVAYVLWDLIREFGEKEKGETGLHAGILNELLAVLSKLGRGRAALEVLDKFDEFGCVPDSASYYFTVDALLRRKNYELALPVCEKMLSSGNLPEGEELGKIISMLCQGKAAQFAHLIYLAAKEKGKVLPLSVIKVLTASLSRDDETVKLAQELLADIEGESRKYAISPFSAVIRGLCRMKDLDRAKKLLHEMIEVGPPPSNAVFNMVINGFSKARGMATAMEMEELMESRGLMPDLFTYTVLMSGFVSGGEMKEARKLLKQAKKKHKKLTPVMYHTIIRGYCKLEEYDNAVGMLKEMKSFGVEPNADEYNKLIQSLCLKALDTETAEKLLEEMKENGLHLNGITRGLIRAVKELQGDELAAEGTRIEA